MLQQNAYPVRMNKHSIVHGAGHAQQSTLNAQQAAELLGVHRNTVLNWLAAEPPHLKGDKVGREWWIPRSEIERVAQLDESHQRDWEASAGAAAWLGEWQSYLEVSAFGEIVASARELLRAWGDAETVRDGRVVAPVPKLEAVERQLQALMTAVQGLGKARSMRPFVRALRVEARQRGREFDDRIVQSVADIVAKAEGKGELPRDWVSPSERSD